ncbi:sigma-70 family RNA polymerase sigma factor [Paraconexibacter algicola]|uniref:RNA polymerase sigma-70 region 2 domain-containing protein n=1 Tax=Paraconexibacter algicola TaxID=2133960 RepID=A0A2T4ULZ9_9ACTN|nr:sigma-70 family RNA polymerase sigma factor [Paraconexibacter algicola]PTL60249.1 hypothetical protein C7Y72_11675 [Paraconexibacter algicola]
MALAPQADERAELDRAFEEHRAAIMTMLRLEFAGVDDHEDLYQEAWVEALEKIKQGTEVRNLRAFLRLIAWRRARDKLRNVAATPEDPEGYLLRDQLDSGPLPDEIAQVHIDAKAVRNVIDELDERRAAAVKMRFDLGMSSTEIERALGISRKRLDKLLGSAYRLIEEQLVADETGEAPWTRRQRSLLFTCLSGMASEGQRARAQRLVDTDPACRAMLAQMRASLDKVAAALPVPVVLEGETERSLPFFDQLQNAVTSVRETVASLLGRSGGQASTFEPVAGGLAGVSAAGAAKVVVVCISLGAGAATCVEFGVVGGDPKPENAQAKEYEKRPAAKEEQVAAVAPRPTPTPRPVVRKRSKPKAATPAATPSAPVPKTNGPAAASPAPAGSVEFGPGSVGSVPASRQPAAAPVDGGGEFTP